MPTITYTKNETLGRGAMYTARTTIAGRHVTLGHYYLDNYPTLDALKAACSRDAPGRLQVWHYTTAEIAEWQAQ
jgi:hypothetical protein